MSFFGVVVKGDSSHKFTVPEGSNLVVTQAAIDSNIKESTVLYVETQGSPKLALATFAAGRSEQSRFDLIFDSNREVTFSVKGKAEVHIVGYYSANNGPDEDDFDFGSSDEDEEDFDEDDSEDEEESVPQGGKRALPSSASQQPAKKAKTENGAAPKKEAPKKPQQNQQNQQKPSNQQQNQQKKETPKAKPQQNNQSKKETPKQKQTPKKN